VNATAIADAIERRRLLFALPPNVAIFFARARRLAARRGDDWSLSSATGPQSLTHVLRAARGRRHFVEIGTGTAWTAIAGALAEADRQVISYDPIVRPQRNWYLRLAGSAACQRIDLIAGIGEDGPPAGSAGVDFVFVDGSHERDRTIAAFEAWQSALTPDGAIAFHDWGNQHYPGVTEAITALGLRGESAGDVFIWRPRPRLAY
jgi:predicted O-methyltransferase YrrM